MKRLIVLILGAVLWYCLFWVCGGCSQSPKIPSSILLEIDSLFIEDGKHSFISFYRDIRTENFTLTEEEKMQGASFLLPLEQAKKTKTKKQKYVAFMMYSVDRNIARLYGLPRDAYDEQLARWRMELQIKETDFIPSTAVPMSQESLMTASNRMQTMFRKELREGNFDLFVARVLTLYTENVYILSQNPDCFLKQMSDEDAKIISARYRMFASLLEMSSPYYSNLAPYSVSIQQLQPLGNVSTKEELLTALKNETLPIARFRNSLLD